MTVPREYSRASDEFADFLAEAAEVAGLATRHQSFTMVQGVLWAFRRRLTHVEAIEFANILPPLLRALFVGDWDPSEQQRPFGTRAEQAREVQELRLNHNISPQTSIRDVATVLRRRIEPRVFETCLSKLPAEAAQFWSVAPQF